MSSRVVFGVISSVVAVLVKINSAACRALFFIDPYLEVWRNKYTTALENQVDDTLVEHERVVDEYYTLWQKAVERATLQRDRKFKRLNTKILQVRGS